MKIQIDDAVHDATAAEQTTVETIQAEFKTQAATQAAQAAAKKSAYKKLAALGLTADEIAAL